MAAAYLLQGRRTQELLKAGKAVHLSQPTISSHIRDLENHFGCRLIDRLARQAAPTKAGELLYAYARRLISLREETETALAEFQGRIKGRLVIGGSTIPGTYILPRLVGDFTCTHPETTVALRIGDTDRIIQETLEGKIEFGIVGAKSKDKRIAQEKVIEDEMRLIVQATHPWADQESIPVNRLLAEPFICRERGSGTLKSIQICLARRAVSMEAFTIVAEMGSTEAVCQRDQKRGGHLDSFHPCGGRRPAGRQAESALAGGHRSQTGLLPDHPQVPQPLTAVQGLPEVHPPRNPPGGPRSRLAAPAPEGLSGARFFLGAASGLVAANLKNH